ncbi:D-glucuronyl C5-epimerase family protein [Pseudomonas defluvii]|nr:D-glucuronyl C5-epimerase family protein [Pseudomonas defluvii]
MKKSAKFAIAALSAAAICYAAFDRFGPHWPEPNVSAENIAFGKRKVEEFLNSPLKPSGRSGVYSATGDYLNYSRIHTFRESKNLKLDAEGLPQVRYGSEFHYNPVTISNYALHEYGSSLPGKPNAQFWKAVQKLIEMQGDDGAFRYDFPYRHYAMRKPFPSGWVSGMAQGLAMSVLARAYNAEKDPKYLEAGNKSLAFLNVPTAQGGPRSSMASLDPSLKDYVFFEEYIGEKNIYTLNGFIFTMLGLYDWQSVTGNELANNLYSKSLETLERILPYYDFGGASAYDLTFITYGRPKPTFNIRYHSLHSALLHNLYSITKNETFKKYEKKWNPTNK